MYGLRLVGVPEAARSALVEVPVDAPEIVVEVLLGCSAIDALEGDGDRLLLGGRGASLHDIRRDPPSATLMMPEPPLPQALVHPLLTITCSAHNRWRGALTLHGGAFLGGEGAWAVLADKNAGKSSTMAGLATRGVPVFADDLVVVEGGNVFPGPRSLDLRPDAATRFTGAEDIGFVGGRYRHRIELAGTPLRAPFVGVVTLAWSDDGEVAVTPLAIDEKLRALTRNEGLPLMGAQPAPLLFDAMQVPMYRLSRPRSWDHHERAMDLLMELSGARPDRS